MSEHRAATFARAVVDCGGAGIALRDRPFGHGLEMVVWLPDEYAHPARRMVEDFGWDVTLFARQPRSAFSERFDGYQLKVTVPLEEARVLVRKLPISPDIAELEAGR